MRLATFSLEEIQRIGVVEDDTVALVPEQFGDLVEVITKGSTETIRTELGTFDRVSMDDVDLMAPLQRFQRDILCTGWNYWDHFEEGIGRREGQEVDRPDRPTFFTKGPDTVVGPRDAIGIDQNLSKQWDYEAELAVIIGRDGRNIPTTKAPSHIFGYTLANDVSLRDLQRAHGAQWLKGKSIDGTLPLGPWVTTTDEIDPSGVVIECVLNGEVMQSATTAQMVFDLPTLIAELSEGMTLRAGDVLLSGTPSGVGNARTPQVFLKDGDEVVVRAGGLGELRNVLEGISLTTYQEGA